MKRIRVLVLCLCMFLIPSIVMADAGAPSFSEYKVRVKNPDGTTAIKEWDYQGDKTIIKKEAHYDYDAIIKGIVYEETINNELYGYSQEDDVYVKISDVEAFGEVDLKNFKKDNYIIKQYVFKEGAYLYKGPSKTYGKVANDVMLPVGTTIETDYYDEMFAYVSYNGVKGWVYICQQYYGEGGCPYKEESSLVNVKSGELVSTVDNAKIFKDYDGKEVLTTVPKFSKMKYKYTYRYSTFDYMYYVECNGNKGWIIDVAENCKNCTILTLSDKDNKDKYNVCKTIGYEDCSDVVTTLPDNVIVPVKYVATNFDTWYYVEYNGKSGWIYNEGHDYIPSYNVFEYEKGNKYSLNVNARIYSNIYGEETSKEVELGNIKADYTINDKNNENYKWVHVIEGSNKGWIKVKSSDLKEDPTEEPIKEPENDIPSSTPEYKNKDNKDIFGISFKEFAIYSIVGAIVLAMMIVVILKLVNSDKKEKVKEENKE